MPYTIALVGNPNSGKTSLFNAITGTAQHVGNWPGVTVEKKEGIFYYDNNEIILVDLPGIYSLSPYTPEEIISRNYIIESTPDLIINIVDATNLERNLYLTTQLAELGRPMVIALNMVDMLKSKGIEIDIKALQKLLGIAVCPVSASKGRGIEELVETCIALIKESKNKKKAATIKANAPKSSRIMLEPQKSTFGVFDWKIKSAISAIEDVISNIDYAKKAPLFMAVKLFEGDTHSVRKLNLNAQQQRLINSILQSVPETEYVDRQMMVADQRYKYISNICKIAVKKHKTDEYTMSDKIDRVLTHKFLSIPIFFAIMLLIFVATFGFLGSFLSQRLEVFTGSLSNNLRALFESINVKPFAVSLVCDGIVAGLGAVLSYLPQISLLFLFLSILEDSGYMARAAFVIDRPLRGIGLTGRSFVPLLMGFGCSVPAALATRTLESERNRIFTILLIPFMSCSAKMPVYVLFCSALFKDHQPVIIFSVYLLGIFLAVLIGFILNKFLLKGEDTPFVMELPPYRVPTIKGLYLHMRERIKDFLLKAGTVLLLASIAIWFLQSFDTSLQFVDNSSESILAQVGTKIAPIFKPLGFGFWQASVALLSGLVAKETVVSTFGILYGVASESAQIWVLSSVFTPLSALTFIVFTLLYVPCYAAVFTIYKETRSIKWTTFSVLMQFGTAWFMSFLIYQSGKMLGYS
ncbi:MAG TPA: ferrous iron transport protein B [Clostridiales bacterium]|nr:ferrous iron transport protein B [Clostridiales bacterium]